jgi:dTDP-4-dehydrorhamnose reductase
LKFTPQSIPEVVLIELTVLGDDWGYFVKTYFQDFFEEFIGYQVNFIQDNESKSTKGVLRGLLYQLPPFAQATQIYHYSNEGFISWSDFAKEVFKPAKVNCKALPSLTIESVTSADRPKNISMSKNKIRQELGVETFSWKNSLDKFIHLLRTEKYE